MKQHFAFRSVLYVILSVSLLWATGGSTSGCGEKSQSDQTIKVPAPISGATGGSKTSAGTNETIKPTPPPSSTPPPPPPPPPPKPTPSPIPPPPPTPPPSPTPSEGDKTVPLTLENLKGTWKATVFTITDHDPPNNKSDYLKAGYTVEMTIPGTDTITLTVTDPKNVKSVSQPKIFLTGDGKLKLETGGVPFDAVITGDTMVWKNYFEEKDPVEATWQKVKP